MAAEGKENRWESLWSRGLAPGKLFDGAKVSPILPRLLKEGYQVDSQTVQLPSGRALVPGCGRGYAVAALSKSNETTFGLEISETAVQTANEYLESQSDLGECKMIMGDFFTYDFEEKFDIIFDHTFCCIFSPGEAQEKWAKRHSELLKPTGRLMVLIFPLKPIIPNGGGPPFQMNVDTMISELAKFDLVPEFTPYFLADEDVHERKGNQMTKLGIFKFKDT